MDDFLANELAERRRRAADAFAAANRRKFKLLRWERDDARRKAVLGARAQTEQAANEVRMRWKGAASVIGLSLDAYRREKSLQATETLYGFTRRQGAGARI